MQSHQMEQAAHHNPRCTASGCLSLDFQNVELRTIFSSVKHSIKQTWFGLVAPQGTTVYPQVIHLRLYGISWLPYTSHLPCWDVVLLIDKGLTRGVRHFFD